MGSVLVADEELRSVGVRTGVCHGKQTLVSMREPDLLVIEFFSIDALTTGTVAGSSISSLHHELSNDSMEAISLVMEVFTLFTSAERSEVLGRLRHIFTKELEDNSASLVTLLTFFADGYVEVSLHVLRLEVRKAIVVAGDLGIILIVVNTFVEESGESLLSFGSFRGLLGLDRLPLFTKLRILGS